MNIPLRTFQRSTAAFCDLLTKNSGVYIPVVDASGKILFYAISVTPGDSPPRNQVAPEVESSEEYEKGAKFQELKRQLDARAELNIHTEPNRFGPGTMSSWVGSTGEETLRQCNKCKKPSECRKLVEDGMDYIVCEECAKKAKLPWNKLEKLTT